MEKNSSRSSYRYYNRSLRAWSSPSKKVSSDLVCTLLNKGVKKHADKIQKMTNLNLSCVCGRVGGLDTQRVTLIAATSEAFFARLARVHHSGALVEIERRREQHETIVLAVCETAAA
jgi:hypothetical protein